MKQVKVIIFNVRLRADKIQELLATIRFSIAYRPVSYLKA